MARHDTSRGLADIHVHTLHSDGWDGPAAVLEWARRLGLNVVAITDHDAIAGALMAEELAQQRDDAPDVVVGEEVSSAQGHILGLFLSELIPPGMSAEETVREIHRQGGLSIAPHPFWRSDSIGALGWPYSVGDLIRELPFDAVEVLNGGFTPSMIAANQRAAAAAAAHGLTAVGGSDAHVKQALGWAHTAFAGTGAMDLRASILMGAAAPGRMPIDAVGVSRYAAWSMSKLRVGAAALL